MNIISNNCIGGYVFKFNNEEYKNPFIFWSCPLHSFIYLIKNFDKIDFTNIELKIIEHSNIIPQDKSPKNFVSIIIDNKVYGEFTHHFYDESCTELTKKEFSVNKEAITNIYYCDILNYVKECWFRRLKKFDKKDLVFVFHDFADYWTNVDLNKLINLKTSKKIVIFTQNEKFKNVTPLNKNIKIIYSKNNKFAIQIAKNIFLNKIKL